MSENFTGRIIAIWPQNRKEIAYLNDHLPPKIPRFRASIEHSPTRCDGCDRYCWIGPNQKQLSESPFVLIKKLCMFCVTETMRTLNLDPHPVSTNVDEHLIPRRA